MNISINKPIRVIYGMINDAVDDEVYDMMDHFSKDDVVEFAKSIILGLRKQMTFVYEKDNETDEYFQIKASNLSSGSFVSFSDSDGTGVSNCLGRIFTNVRRPSKEEVKTLLDMINEAYYLCKNQ